MPPTEHGAITLLRLKLARQHHALEAVLPILERGNASYRRIKQKKIDCPTLGPLVVLVRAALGMTTQGGD